MEDTKTITLSPPIKQGEKTYDAIELREPTAGEVDKSSRVTVSGTASLIELIAIVSGVPAVVVQKMPFRQFKEAVTFMNVFTADVPETTES